MSPQSTDSKSSWTHSLRTGIATDMPSLRLPGTCCYVPSLLCRYTLFDAAFLAQWSIDHSTCIFRICANPFRCVCILCTRSRFGTGLGCVIPGTRSGWSYFEFWLEDRTQRQSYVCMRDMWSRCDDKRVLTAFSTSEYTKERFVVPLMQK